MSAIVTHNEERDLVDREVLKRLIAILEEKSVGEITNSGEEVIIKDLAGNIKKSLKVHKRVSYRDRKPNMPMYGEEALKDADCALFSTDTQGNRYLVKPITRENCVEGLGRLRDTAYSVGDIALCAGSQSLQLICTTSGTTSSNELDISANTEGDTITDGTVSWKVVKRNYLGSEVVLPIANGGTGATTAKQARANLEVEPIGTIFAFAGNNIPIGYLPCNGGAISRTTYADLFAVIGTTYGAGNGSTTFNLPNLTDKFIQGSDTVGTVKSAGLPNIHTNINYLASIGKNDSSIFKTTGAFAWGVVNRGNGIALTSNNYFAVDPYIDLSKGNSIYGNSDTVQPPALTMRYIIKY